MTSVATERVALCNRKTKTWLFVVFSVFSSTTHFSNLSDCLSEKKKTNLFEEIRAEFLPSCFRKKTYQYQKKASLLTVCPSNRCLCVHTLICELLLKPSNVTDSLLPLLELLVFIKTSEITICCIF